MEIMNEELFEVKCLNDDDSIMVYAPLRATILRIKKNVAKKVFSKKDSIEKLRILNYIKSKKLINISKVGKKIANTGPEVSISLTNNCNLACVYCHANSNQKKGISKTNSRNIKQIIEFYFSKLDTDFSDAKEAKLSFLGGGEPTIYPDLIVKAINMAQKKSDERKIKLIVVTATNGCFSKKVADIIIKNFTSISLSFDGPKFIQNFHRPFLNGSGSFDKIFRTAKYFQKNNFPFSVRSTLSTITFKRYKEYINFFAKEFPGVLIGAEPMYKLGRGKYNKYAPSPEEFSDGITTLCKYALDKNVFIRNANLGKFNSIKPFYCNSVAIPNINVSPDGNIWACSREGTPHIFNYGKFNFKDGTVIINQQRLKKLKNISVFAFPECANCIGKYHCAGDCPDNRFSGQLKCDGVKSALTIALNQKLKT